jgi:hypothetical protein
VWRGVCVCVSGVFVCVCCVLCVGGVCGVCGVCVWCVCLVCVSGVCVWRMCVCCVCVCVCVGFVMFVCVVCHDFDVRCLVCPVTVPPFIIFTDTNTLVLCVVVLPQAHL